MDRDRQGDRRARLDRGRGRGVGGVAVAATSGSFQPVRRRWRTTRNPVRTPPPRGPQSSSIGRAARHSSPTPNQHRSRRRNLLIQHDVTATESGGDSDRDRSSSALGSAGQVGDRRRTGRQHVGDPAPGVPGNPSTEAGPSDRQHEIDRENPRGQQQEKENNGNKTTGTKREHPDNSDHVGDPRSDTAQQQQSEAGMSGQSTVQDPPIRPMPGRFPLTWTSAQLRPGTRLVALSGELDILTAPSMLAALQRPENTRATHLVISLVDVDLPR